MGLSIEQREQLVQILLTTYLSKEDLIDELDRTIAKMIRNNRKYCGCAWCCAKVPPHLRGETHQKTCSAQ